MRSGDGSARALQVAAMVSASFQQQTDLGCSKLTQATPQTLMDKKAASRIQSRYACANGGGTPKGSFPARAQSAADKRQCSSTGPDHSPDSSGSPFPFDLVVGAVAVGAVTAGLCLWCERRHHRQQEAKAHADKVGSLPF